MTAIALVSFIVCAVLLWPTVPVGPPSPPLVSPETADSPAPLPSWESVPLDVQWMLRKYDFDVLVALRTLVADNDALKADALALRLENDLLQYRLQLWNTSAGEYVPLLQAPAFLVANGHGDVRWSDATLQRSVTRLALAGVLLSVLLFARLPKYAILVPVVAVMLAMDLAHACALFESASISSKSDLGEVAGLLAQHISGQRDARLAFLAIAVLGLWKGSASPWQRLLFVLLHCVSPAFSVLLILLTSVTDTTTPEQEGRKRDELPEEGVVKEEESSAILKELIATAQQLNDDDNDNGDDVQDDVDVDREEQLENQLGINNETEFGIGKVNQESEETGHADDDSTLDNPQPNRAEEDPLQLDHLSVCLIAATLFYFMLIIFSS